MALFSNIGYIEVKQDTFYPEGYEPPRLIPDDAFTYPYSPPPAPIIDPGYSTPFLPPVTTHDAEVPQNNTPFSRVEITGSIYDEAGRPLMNVLLSLVDKSGKIISPPLDLENATWYAWTEGDGSNAAVIFQKKGYETQKIFLIDFENRSTDIIMKGGGGFPMWIILAVVAAVMLYKKKTKKVGALNSNDLLPIFLIGGGLIAFSIIRPILEKLGLWDSRDTKELDNAATDPGSFWNPNYWKVVKPDNQSYTYVVTTEMALKYIQDIVTSFSGFDDCEECVIAIFKKMRTKANVSFLAYVFQESIGQDLLTYLRGGWWPEDRLSDEDVNTINNYVKNLPNY